MGEQALEYTGMKETFEALNDCVRNIIGCREKNYWGIVFKEELETLKDEILRVDKIDYITNIFCRRMFNVYLTIYGFVELPNYYEQDDNEAYKTQVEMVSKYLNCKMDELKNLNGLNKTQASQIAKLDKLSKQLVKDKNAKFLIV